MAKIFVFLSVTLLLACNFTTDPRDDGQDDNDEVTKNEYFMFYEVTYQEFDRTIVYNANSASWVYRDFFAENELMTKITTRDVGSSYFKKDVEPADIIETSITYRVKEGDIVTSFAIPKITVEEIPSNVSRTTGFEIQLGGEAIQKDDFVELVLYNPETKKSVAVYSLQPTIPGMEDKVSIAGQTIKISSGFMEWFGEFESGKTYLLSINRSPGGRTKEEKLNYTVDYQVKYSSAHHPIKVEP